jgi:anaerobic ribonucleoside-triphosphate reductase
VNRIATKRVKESFWKNIGEDDMTKTKCEVYSRVVGYIRPVSNWNDSKQAEFTDRKKFDSAVGSKDCGCQ